MTQSCEELTKTHKEQKNYFESNKKQLHEALAKEKLEKKQLEKKIKELENTISEHSDALKVAGHKAIKYFKSIDGK
ncbi:hypothetical protein PanWU01x14_315250 [Parasponia andersonii]|uniref:Uncharacterized protein n=1 Tax=Parasponia andersonii TaxID=3476 RepID=A0A2P5ANH7_PARAD|nr:hypothetical protein PanWU01x14_315250 [Parasponia andersonii]